MTIDPAPRTDVPPDPDGQNEERARWALETVRFFQLMTGSNNATAVADLVCDLMHMMDRYGGMEHDQYHPDIDSVYVAAQEHYQAETEGD